ncbi:hypothetical protein [Robiginitalea sp. SC105]|uniref:hypothetical protein n=1 Tax=Robiginitalea sp. SC105 TaxID=2762332 RepID=UPI00163A0793|nr:hypothetical protein [Robiginitalea sp. SC105]MBC2838608.1 hypothetical protein [Robiginitalea sp. SC105]
MEEFRDKGFERLKDCDAIEDCIRGLDGTTTTFESIDAGGPKTASFWELESDYYYDQKALEVPDEVLKARSFISAINKEFDLSEQFQNFLNRLPRGRYAYNHLIMKKG